MVLKVCSIIFKAKILEKMDPKVVPQPPDYEAPEKNNEL